MKDRIFLKTNPPHAAVPAGSVAIEYDPHTGAVVAKGAGESPIQLGNGETQNAATITGGGTACTLTLNNGTFQTATLTASTGCTFTMPAKERGKSFMLLLKQAASTGNGTATFTGVKWNASGAPTITATAGKMDILSFVCDGTNWYGIASQGYTP